MRSFIALFLCFNFAYGQNAEVRLLDRINNPDVTSGFYRANKFISNSATPISIAVPSIVLVVGLVKKDGSLTNKAIYVFESLAVDFVVTHAAKAVINRERPAMKYPFIIQKMEANSASFPSGHTSFAFAMATSVSIACPKWYVMAPCFAYASAVGYSRMYMGVHYPSDVLAGAAFGAGSAWLTHKANKWLRRKSVER